MEVSSTITSHLIVLGCLPVVIESAHPLVNLKVVKSGIGNKLLFDGGRVC